MNRQNSYSNLFWRFGKSHGFRYFRLYYLVTGHMTCYFSIGTCYIAWLCNILNNTVAAVCWYLIYNLHYITKIFLNNMLYSYAI